MLTQEFRPRRFSQVVGQELSVEILRSIVDADPEKAPRSLILMGQFGCGKTTAARIFARALNCKNRGKNLEPCLDCDICNSPTDFTPFYQEYDSSDVGSVETIRGMKDDLFFSSSLVKSRVVVFDEAHLLSRQAQSALLKTLEDMPSNTFVLFCTTDVEKVIPTIRSRSIELSFQRVNPIAIRDNLASIAEQAGIDIGKDVLGQIALYSRGHVRDSVMRLDLFRMMEDKSAFLKTLKSSELELIEMLLAAKAGNKERYRELLKSVCSQILDTVNVDFFEVLKNGIEAYATENVRSIYRELI